MCARVPLQYPIDLHSQYIVCRPAFQGGYGAQQYTCRKTFGVTVSTDGIL